jgi:hypothetical protein
VGTSEGMRTQTQLLTATFSLFQDFKYRIAGYRKKATR